MRWATMGMKFEHIPTLLLRWYPILNEFGLKLYIYNYIVSLGYRVDTSIANWVYKPTCNSAGTALYGSSTVVHNNPHLYMSRS